MKIKRIAGLGLLGLIETQTMMADDLSLNLLSSVQNVNTRPIGFVFTDGISNRNSLSISKEGFTGTIWTDFNAETGNLIELDIVGCYREQASDKKLNIGVCLEHYKYPKLDFESENYLSMNASYTTGSDLNFRLMGRHFLGNNLFGRGTLYQLTASFPFELDFVNMKTSTGITYVDNFFEVSGLTVGRIELSGSYDINNNFSINGFIQKQIHLDNRFTDETILGIGLSYNYNLNQH